jgi:hypothetical protein
LGRCGFDHKFLTIGRLGNQRRPDRIIIQAIAPIIAAQPRAGMSATKLAPVATNTTPKAISAAQTSMCQGFISYSLVFLGPLAIS